MDQTELRRFARAGAAAELERIYSAFPELKAEAQAAPVAVVWPKKKKKRTISAQGRRNIAAGQRRRWAQRRGEQRA